MLAHKLIGPSSHHHVIGVAKKHKIANTSSVGKVCDDDDYDDKGLLIRTEQFIVYTLLKQH